MSLVTTGPTSAGSARDIVAAVEAQRGRLVRRQRLEAAVSLALFATLLAVSLKRGGLIGAEIGADPLGRIADFLGRLSPQLRLGVLFADRQTPGSLGFWLYDLPHWLALVRQTLEMAILATVLGAVGAAVAGLLCARNLMPLAPVRVAVRRTLEAIRTLPDVILALLLVAVFGVGAFAGVLALAISTAGGLGKLFAEINEQADPGPMEAIAASGASRLRQIRYAVLPQVLPAYASYALIRLEANLAGATALGLVGAGGIGIELQRAITFTEFQTYLALLLLIVAMIFVIDVTSEAIRHRLLGLERRA
jgi:phosphonate transport system permease protein